MFTIVDIKFSYFNFLLNIKICTSKYQSLLDFSSYQGDLQTNCIHTKEQTYAKLLLVSPIFFHPLTWDPSTSFNVA